MTDLNTIERKLKAIKEKDFKALSFDDIFNIIEDLKEELTFFADTMKDNFIKELAEHPRTAKTSIVGFIKCNDLTLEEMHFYRHLKPFIAEEKKEEIPFFPLEISFNIYYKDVFYLSEKLTEDLHNEKYDQAEIISTIKKLKEYIYFDLTNTLQATLQVMYIYTNPTLKAIFSLQNYRTYKDKCGIVRTYTHYDEAYNLAFILNAQAYKKTLDSFLQQKETFLNYTFYFATRFFMLDNLLYFYKEDTPPDYFTKTTKDIILYLASKGLLINCNDSTNDEKLIDRDANIIGSFNGLESIQDLKDFFNLFLDLHTYALKKAEEQTEEKEALQQPFTFEVKKYDVINNIKLKPLKATNTTSENEDQSDKMLLSYFTNHNAIEETNTIKKQRQLKVKINNYRKKNPDFIGTNEDIKKIIIENEKNTPKETTNFDLYENLGLEDELKKIGITHDFRKDGSKEEIYIESTFKNVKNILNIEDKDLYLKYGEEAIKTKKFIEAKVFTIFATRGLDAITPTTAIKIDAEEYNFFYNRKNDYFYTMNQLENTLTTLKLKSIQYTNEEKGSIFDTNESKITKYDIEENTKKTLLRIVQEKKLLTDFITNFYSEKDNETNRKTFFILLNPLRIAYLQLLYINNRIITDNTAPLKAIRGNTNKKARADAIKDKLLILCKQDRKQRKELKDNNYTKYETTHTIGYFVNYLKEANLLKENDRKYKETIKEPLKEAFDYLKDGGVIDYYTTAFTDYDKDTSRRKKTTFEAQEIVITLLNDNF